MRRLVFLFTLLATACGGATPEVTTGAGDDPSGGESSSSEAGPVQVEGLLGAVDEQDVERVMKKGMRRIERCYAEALDDLEEIEGSLQLSIKVGARGQVDQVFVSDGDLGSALAQGCIEEAVAGFEFPAPRGGTQAQIGYPLTLEAPYDNPAPADLSGAVKKHARGQGAADLERCLGSVTGVRLTVYVGSDGRVISAGANPASSFEEVEAARCLEQAAAGWTFDDAPGKGIAKAVVDF